MTKTDLHKHKVVSPNEWLEARKKLLIQEKEFTRVRDQVSAQRRELPWVKVETEYVFEGPNGEEALADLFEGRSQLIIYHFMFAPEWEEGCPSCSFWADNFNPIVIHLNHRDVAFAAISRAPIKKLSAFRERMGWSFKWVSSGKNKFNYDYHVSFPAGAPKEQLEYNYSKLQIDSPDLPGVSVFYKDGKGNIFHTYSAYSRGIDILNTAYNYLDLVPKGRDEDDFEFSMEWLRYHDRYDV
jgi:predicted dithiol-disulfide oxidoreductase (DUF899 family)